MTACIGMLLSVSLCRPAQRGGLAGRSGPIVVDRGRRNDGAVCAPRQGEMPDFAVFVGSILTERLIGPAEPPIPAPRVSAHQFGVRRLDDLVDDGQPLVVR